MTSDVRVSRRLILQAGAATSALGAPGFLLAQPATIKIGLVHPVSGGLAYSGGQGRLGCQMAIDEINAAGGIKSMGGAKLEAALGDSQSRPEVGVSEVERLHQAGVAAYVGCFSSAIALPATQAAAKYNTPFMIDVGVSDQIVRRGLKNVFRLAPGFGKCVDDAIVGLGEINKAAGGVAKTAVLVHEESEFGTGTAKLLADRLPGINVQVAEIIKHANPTRDFSNVALRIKSLKPDLVIMSNYQNEYVLLARSIHQNKVPKKAIYSVIGGGASNMKFVREFNAAAQGIMDCNHWIDPRKPRSQRLVSALDAAKVDLTYEVLLNYSNVLLAIDAIEKAGSGDRDKINQALTNSTFDGHVMPYGPTKFVNGQNEGARPINTQIQGMKVEVVYPPEYATAKMVFPVPLG